MPNCVEHKEKLDENLSFLTIECLRVSHKDWYITGVFYSAVHLIEAYLNAFNGKDSANHVERAKSIKADGFLKNIFPSYKTIYEQSLRARYENHRFTEDDVECIDDCYREISDRINNKVDEFAKKQQKLLNNNKST